MKRNALDELIDTVSLLYKIKFNEEQHVKLREQLERENGEVERIFETVKRFIALHR